jgi:hypothetical protein
MTKLGFVPTTKAIKYWSNASPGIWSNAEGTIPSIIWRKRLFFDSNFLIVLFLIFSAQIWRFADIRLPITFRQKNFVITRKIAQIGTSDLKNAIGVKMIRPEYNKIL